MSQLTRRRTGLVFAVVLVIGAAAFAGWFGWSWTRASADADNYVETREEVLRVGEQGIANLTTMDHRAVDEGLNRWLSSSTGALRDSLVQGMDESRKQIAEGKTVTVGKVVDAAVTELEVASGIARVIAAVEITVTPDGGRPVVKRNRFEAGLDRTEAGWRLSSLRAVVVGES
ncbi:hypothetical protein GCM10012275_34860 [Longimycelium tulufanense]|uniref:Mce-associated membrane protein n=1 Tax=Longimycelium tulufanense TaxID=907463 RepID=A0A8J3CFQ6_9PSEU|nr:hypothetical protein [Longimycelium tulufanense]GGM60842.1 hypothetical protein GCM10012275_34860 [Longimycelium tulufanense]